MKQAPTKLKTSLIINFVNVGLILITTILMMLNIKWMGDIENLTAPGLSAFQFFTVDSNLFLGVASILVAIYELLLIKGKVKDIPRFVYLIKFAAVVSTTLTFLMVVTVLCPMLGSDWWKLYMNNNLFFHLLCPLIGLVGFVFFERFSPFKFKETLWGLLPMVVYSIYYMINVLTHFDGGPVPYEYDWYGFAQGGVPSMIIYALVTYVMTFVISVLVWLPIYITDKKERKIQ